MKWGVDSQGVISNYFAPTDIPDGHCDQHGQHRRHCEYNCVGKARFLHTSVSAKVVLTLIEFTNAPNKNFKF